MNVLKDILLQLFFLFIPLYLYYRFVYKKSNGSSEFKRQFTVFLYCTIPALLCMHYPVEVNDGYYFNLSILPAIISILYGGYLSGLLTIMIVFTYPVLAGIESSMLTAVLPASLLLILTAVLQPRWKSLSKNKKYIVTVTIFFIKLLLIYFLLFLQYLKGVPLFRILNEMSVIAWSSLILIASAILLVYSIEYLRDIAFLQKQLQKKKRLQHISNIGVNTSEQIQQPLIMIKGFTQLLGAEQNRKNKEYVPIILSELNYAEKLIDSYLSLAKTASFPTRAISSKELIQHVKTEIYPYAQNSQVDILQSRQQNLRLRGNWELLSESLMNILKYCIDASELPNSQLEIKNYLKRNNVIIEIVDSHSAITYDKLHAISRLHVQNDAYTCHFLHKSYMILLAHDGDLQLKRGLWKRNTIMITLPAYVKRKNKIKQRMASG